MVVPGSVDHCHDRAELVLQAVPVVAIGRALTDQLPLPSRRKQMLWLETLEICSPGTAVLSVDGTGRLASPAWNTHPRRIGREDDEACNENANGDPASHRTRWFGCGFGGSGENEREPQRNTGGDCAASPATKCFTSQRATFSRHVCGDCSADEYQADDDRDYSIHRHYGNAGIGHS